ncbi:MAG TPA: hypothetical protein VGR73_16025 [Bryobacteraceae bacterium]|nr:hypothetical protein [Bryobacteraceae bacterium]
MPKPSKLTGLLIFLAIYFVCLVFLLPRQPLWLDEILTLIVTQKPDWPSFLASLRALPSIPFEPLFRGIPIQLAGYSLFTARVSSAVFSVGACAGTFVLSNRLGLRRPLLAVLLLAACPLQLRYATEARPYAFALCWSVWATVIFLAWLDHPGSRVLAWLYGFMTVISVYVLAFALFVPAAHFLWLLASPKRWSGNKRVMAICGSSLALAALAIVPWYLFARRDWQAYSSALRLGSYRNSRPIAIVVHELTGAGYVGNALLILGAILGIRRVGPVRGFWIGYILVPVVLAMAGDLTFGYFLAIRQLIFVLPPLLLMFAVGAEPLGWKGCLLVAAFLTASIYADVSWFRRPREDWQAAAAAAAVAQENACVTFAPPDAEKLYLFFQPELRARECTTETDAAMLAVSPYDPDHAYESARRGLNARGLTLKSRQEFHGPRVELYAK